ncbi:MAG: nucleotide exchange factor GrpE [Planctomycetes bacterium]|nr:nucleotide exchange factor GrpE [Planctomycetota bacterium]
MAKDKHNEVIPEGEPHEGHDADQALHDADAMKTAGEAQAGEQIVEDENLSPKQRAKKLRKLDDEELLAVAEQAVKAEHWLEVAKRSQAEMENTIRRIKREAQDDLKFAAGSLVRELLPVLDNLSRALQATAQSKDFKALFEGVELTNKMFTDALARHGVTPIEAEGRTFDPAVHEALMTTNNPDLEDNAVAMELERGWKLHDRVLRASKVQVNKK